MAYSDFTLKNVVKDFGVKLIEDNDVFGTIEPIEISDYLRETLDDNVPLALSINTEKARSELIIINVFLEIKKKYKKKVSLFSGVKFDVDSEKNLTGFCDFIISDSPEQLFISAPIVTIVEAKNENIIGGLGQCIAEMIGATIFNERENNQVLNIYGIVTSGSSWKFLKMNNSVVFVDIREYHIENIEKIIGIISAMVEQKA